MALAISQESYDQVVRENVEDLDMTLEEAAQDAIQQFKAQVNFTFESLWKGNKLFPFYRKCTLIYLGCRPWKHYNRSNHAKRS